MRTFRVVALLVLLGGGWFGQGLTAADQAPVVPGSAGAAAPADDGLLECPSCSGKGILPCPAHCKEGKIRCPGHCLKPDDPNWKVRPGKNSDGKKWIAFPIEKPGFSDSRTFSFDHCGQIIQYKNGVPESAGPCPVCHGTTLVECKACKGVGHLACPVCEGAKRVTPSKAADFAAKQRAKRENSAIHLRDGRILYGSIIGRGADTVMIRTEDGKIVKEAIANVPAEASGSAGAAPAASSDTP